MYGLIGKMIAAPGQRDALIDILLESTDGMPGCRSYVIATDPADENAIWITEEWDSEASHQASLQLPEVRQAIARGRPMIAGFGERFVTAPVGGHGLGGDGSSLIFRCAPAAVPRHRNRIRSRLCPRIPPGRGTS